MAEMNRMAGGIIVLTFGTLLLSCIYIILDYFDPFYYYTGADYYLEFYLLFIIIISIMIGGFLLFADKKAGSILAIICATILIIYYFAKMGLYIMDHPFPTLDPEVFGLYVIAYFIPPNLFPILVIVGALLGLKSKGSDSEF